MSPVSTILRRTAVRRLGLFLLSMAVPCVVPIALGVRIIVQQEELAEKRRADERRLLVNGVEQVLLTTLEQIRPDLTNPSIALVATVADGRLVLPWEPAAAADTTANPKFLSALAIAEREEYGAENLDLAERATRSALRLQRVARVENAADCHPHVR